MRLETQFDDNLRERADDEQQLRAAIEKERRDMQSLRDELAENPETLDRTRLGRTLNRLSEHLKLADEYDEACNLCEEAIAIWQDLGRDRAVFLARLRRAEIEAVRGHLDAAIDEADALVEATDDEPFAIYRDFALECRGRVRAMAGETEAGLADLERALERRHDEGRDRLAERTEQLLERAEQR